MRIVLLKSFEGESETIFVVIYKYRKQMLSAKLEQAGTQ
jgi:hypothetical protein